ncbi:MAG TPA: beta-ketoacyl-ACP synthase III [Verrucomicrobiae bacterium]|nr:beta-ketoacyl-ACP synthase III [Verrucomicrobiae bacterium]
MTSSSKPHLRSPRSRRPTRSVHIVGTGSYVPDRVLTNADLEQMVDTTDEWITTRSGIKERRIAPDYMCTSDMGAAAARRAMEQAGVREDEVDLIICATITPDMPFPATACLIQQKLGVKRSAAFDMEAACSGFLYGLEIGQQFITSGTYDTVVVIGAEKLSTIVDWQDRSTCVLFGDGAGAAVLRSRGEEHGILTTCMGADGSQADILLMPGGGAKYPASKESVSAGMHYLKMAGKEVFKNAVTAMQTAAEEALRKCNLTIADIKCVIPHQANIRILESLADRLGAPMEKVYVNLHRYGNISAASVAIALDEAAREGRFQRGDLILLVVFGSGLTWASCVIQW